MNMGFFGLFLIERNGGVSNWIWVEGINVWDGWDFDRDL